MFVQVIACANYLKLFTHASLIFDNPCLGKLAYESTAAAILMAGLFISFIVEYFGHRLLLFFFSRYGDHRDLHSFPTRRSSDLLAASCSREDMACSIQTVLEDTMLTSMQRLLAQHPARHLGVAGGVFANVKLNRVLAEQLPIDELFVFPAMGDEGLPIGGALAYLLQRDGLPHWLDRRQSLGDVYLGRDYSDSI